MSLRKYSEHRLGNHLPPTDPQIGGIVDHWMEYAWKRILARGLDATPPDDVVWGRQLALTGLRISNPHIMKWFSRWIFKDGREVRYAQAVKPYNQFVHVTLAPDQVGEDEHITLVKPSDANSEKSDLFANIHDPEGKAFRVIARKSTFPDLDTLFGMTYEDIIDEHRRSTETKFLSASEDKLTFRSRGILKRQHIHVAQILHIGKEANEFELVQAGLIDQREDIQTIYEKDPWEELWPIVAKMSVEEIIEITGYSKRMAYAIKSGERRPSAKIINTLMLIRSNPNQ